MHWKATLNPLDPHSPLVLDTRELGRRAGSMNQVSLTVPAPAGMGIMSIGVPEGSGIEMDLRLESVVEGVLVTGTALVQLAGECSRCLDPITDELDVDLQELYRYETTDAHGRPTGAIEQDVDDDDQYMFGDFLDLEPVLRDAVVIELPLAPVCRDDCLGLCSECGYRLDDDPNHSHDVIDPRWAALGTLGLAEPGSTGPTEDEKEEG